MLGIVAAVNCGKDLRDRWVFGWKWKGERVVGDESGYDEENPLAYPLPVRRGESKRYMKALISP